MIQISKKIRAYADYLTDKRRELHQIPEIGYCEHETQSFILRELSEYPCFTAEKCAGTGVKAVCLREGAKKTIAFRADMDALSVREDTGVCYASRNEGFMHACGHDGHMSILLGLARLIQDNLDMLKYNVVLIFQPAEESYGGAEAMINAGCLENPQADVMYGYHLMPSISIGTIGLKSGAMMAQASEFDVEFFGRSAHGAMPHLGADAIAAACQFVTSTQGIVARCIDPYEQCVVTYGGISGGEARNIVCDYCLLKGTMRTFSEEIYSLMRKRLASLANACAEAYSANAKYTEKVVYPFVDNPVQQCEELLDIIGGNNTVNVRPMMIAEDFSFYQRHVPAVFMFLGCRNPRQERTLHSEKFNFDESALAAGLQVYAKILKI